MLDCQLFWILFRNTGNHVGKKEGKFVSCPSVGYKGRVENTMIFLLTPLTILLDFVPRFSLPEMTSILLKTIFFVLPSFRFFSV